MKTQVRKCGFTGKLFEHEPEYLSHLKRLRSHQKTQRASRRIIQNWESELNDLQHNCINFSELSSWLNDNFHKVVTIHNHMVHHGRQHKGLKLNFEFRQMRFSSCASNTHSHPKGGVRNWEARPDKPRGYPGWQGQIHIQGWQNFNGFFSNYLELMNIHTGSGSCGDYGVIIYAQDWPGMHTYEQIMRHSI
jgi:hypothetical protein